MKGINRMSDTTSAPPWGARAVAAGLAALLLAALAAFCLTPRADASFSLPKCGGSDIIARGGSFATEAQKVFNLNFKTNYCPGGSNVEYQPQGSGKGVESMKLRTEPPRFGGTDDPPTPLAVAQMNAGTLGEPGADPNPNDNGKIHVFPIAVGSVVPLVNFPEGCDPELLNNEFRTISKKEIEDTPTKKGLLRVRFPKALFEEVWAGGTIDDKWSNAFPELAGHAACEVPITRVVRFDQSGTTFTLKDYLNSINPGREWKTKFATEPPNETRNWPNAEFGFPGTGEEKSQCGAKVSAPGGKDPTDATDHLTSACANGNGELIKKLAATDGAIGYSDLATARNASPTLAVNPAGAAAPTTPYWTQAQNGSGTFTEPTADNNGYRTDGSKGSNCGNVVFKNVPANSFGDWSNTSGVNFTTGWGICTLTYALVFDDNAPVWKNTPEEEAKARTVKDYEESIVTEGAQLQLFPADYAPLPASILAISRAAVAEISWNKSASGGGGGGGGTPPPPKGGGGGGAAPPSNAFSIPRQTISSKQGTATFSVKLPGAGQLELTGTAKSAGHKIKVGHVVLTVSQAGTFSVTLKPSAAAKNVLKKKGKLTVSLSFTFSPTGGTPKTTTGSVTLKMVKTH
jgi:ABC-type phosphate transport system substrate-binding protein